MQRLTSGIVLVLLIFGTCFLGGLPLGFFVAVIGYIGLQEFYKVFHLSITKELGRVGFLGTFLWFFSVFLVGEDGSLVKRELKWLALLLIFMCLMAVYVFTFPKYNTIHVMTVFFGIVYVPVMLSFIYLTRMLQGGFYLVWLIFLSSWGCDTFAYCVGMLIGRHKLAPT
ncbi:MAG: phosphatidate cytidylyltransferase [Lachnospiraceae bacterium]|nr:phosphatidate cytidylyltransferase [Lachnospiraceae bacterium]